MPAFRFTLDPGSKKHTCPKCNKKRYVRYIDNQDRSYLSYEYGRCDREIHCGYHYGPYKPGMRDHFQFRREPSTERGESAITRKRSLGPSIISNNIYKRSLTNYGHNNFVRFLCESIDVRESTKAIERYHLGTSQHWPGSTIFWQIDHTLNIRSGKIMLYDENTGNRVKEPYNHVTWVHKVLKINNFSLRQCLFGEHLLDREPRSLVAITESEKTAIIASIYFPQFVWLASGSINNLAEDKIEVLRGHIVYLFPDLGGYQIWCKKAHNLRKVLPGSKFVVSDLLERNASTGEHRIGLDLADYLLRIDLSQFRGGSHRSDSKDDYAVVSAECENGESSKQKDIPASIHINFDDYVMRMTVSHNVVMADGYPAAWDLTSKYLNQHTRDFIKLTLITPRLLSFQRRLGLTVRQDQQVQQA